MRVDRLSDIHICTAGGNAKKTRDARNSEMCDTLGKGHMRQLTQQPISADDNRSQASQRQMPVEDLYIFASCSLIAESVATSMERKS